MSSRNPLLQVVLISRCVFVFAADPNIDVCKRVVCMRKLRVCTNSVVLQNVNKPTITHKNSTDADHHSIGWLFHEWSTFLHWFFMGHTVIDALVPVAQGDEVRTRTRNKQGS